VPAPRWFFRAIYDRESASWERRRDQPDHVELVERVTDELARFVAPPGPVADLGCGPGAHVRALAVRGYEVTGVDGAPRMVEVARARAARDGVEATFVVHDVTKRLPFADGSLAGVISVLLLQHLAQPSAFVAEVVRCLQPGGHLLITAPTPASPTLRSPSRYWRLRARLATGVPGVVRFSDLGSLTQLVEDQGLAVVESAEEPGQVRVLARA
jgi:SAM-dependent methyltransferase